MRTMRYQFLPALLLLALVNVCFAVSPPPRKTLAERVALATHICVGVVKKIRVVELRDGKLHEVSPQPTTINFDQYAELEVEVTEAMRPAGWKPVNRIKYLFGGGNFDVASIWYDTRERERVYLLRQFPVGKETYFLPSYEWHLSESIMSKPEILAIIDQAAQANADGKKD